jgi:transcriptional regulator with XRE-family HTH domain/tetratricopeptide (TPR) repeat protein
MPVLFQHALLVRARVELGLTQEEAAAAVGVDVRTYRRYESGEVNEGGSFAVQRASRRKIVERLCRELGIDEAELLKPEARRVLPGACLPRARHFVGRVPELARLRAWLRDADTTARVVAIVAIGGAGKTSLLEHALSQWHDARESAPFVHSFYEQPSVDAFLEAAAAHLGESGSEPLGDVLHGLRRSPRTVLALDGLELVQADGEGERARGELSDRRLVRLLRAVARDRALGRVLATSRFPLADLAGFEASELETLALPPLDANDTQALLTRLGVRASPTVLDAVVSETGGHALSLAVMGAYAAELLGGDLAAASALTLSDAVRDQPLARKLQAMLDRYAAELVPLERQLLTCVCVFPRGAPSSSLARLPELDEVPELDLRAALGRLVHRGLVVQGTEHYSAHPFIRAHFAALAVNAPEIHARERTRLAADLTNQPAQRPEDPRLLDRHERLFEHTLLAGDVEGAFAVMQRKLGGFAHLGLRLGEFERGLRLVNALERVRKELPPDAGWRVTYDRGLYTAALGDLAAAVRTYEALLERDESDATTHRTLAYTLRLRGELPRAHRHVERSIELGRRDGALGTVALGLALRGALLTTERRLEAAGAAFREVRALGDTPSARRAIWEAEYLLAKGEVELAAAQTLSNLELCRERGWAGHVAHCNVILGRAAVLRGAFEEAEEALDAALDWCRRSREVELTLEAQLLELSIARRTGDSERASRVHGVLLDAAIAGGYDALRASLDAQ